MGKRMGMGTTIERISSDQGLIRNGARDFLL